MGSGAVAEGRALLATIREEGGSPGVSGYSMGGNVAALISATLPFPVASAPLAAAHSPAPVYLDGALRGGIDWEALGGEDEAAPRLRAFMLRASVQTVDPVEHTRHAVIVAADSDGYVPRQSTEILHDHWPGSELRWVRGGHASLFWFRKRLMVDAIADAFGRLESAG
jgi:pimeloyl-ACP methyl ester carboxylesterase